MRLSHHIFLSADDIHTFAQSAKSGGAFHCLAHLHAYERLDIDKMLIRCVCHVVHSRRSGILIQCDRFLSTCVASESR